MYCFIESVTACLDFGNHNFAVSVGTVAWEEMTGRGDITTSSIAILDFSLYFVTISASTFHHLVHM